MAGLGCKVCLHIANKIKAIFCENEAMGQVELCGDCLTIYALACDLNNLPYAGHQTLHEEWCHVCSIRDSFVMSNDSLTASDVCSKCYLKR